MCEAKRQLCGVCSLLVAMRPWAHIQAQACRVSEQSQAIQAGCFNVGAYEGLEVVEVLLLQLSVCWYYTHAPPCPSVLLLLLGDIFVVFF